MSRTPYDTYAKDLTTAFVSAFGTAESDARISAETQFADLRFVLDPARKPRRPKDLLAQLLEPQELFEFARRPPDSATFASWLRKRDAWWQMLIHDAVKREVAPPEQPPYLCALSAGDPVEARRRQWLRPWRGHPGCWVGPPDATFRLVVISALPETRETMLVRTMGSGETWSRAMKELEALPPDAPERTIAGHAVVRLRLELKEDPSDEARKTMMETQKLYEDIMRQQLELGISLGVERGLERGMERGLERGMERGLREAILQVCAARGLALSDAQRAKVASESRADVLLRWHAKAVTAAMVADIFAA